LHFKLSILYTKHTVPPKNVDVFSQYDIKTDFYDNLNFINEPQPPQQCHYENCIQFEELKNENELNLDFLGDDLENLIMIDNMNPIQQQPQPQINDSTNTNINYQHSNSTLKILNELEIKTADINNTDLTNIFRGLSQFDPDKVPKTEQTDLADMVIEGQEMAVNNENEQVTNQQIEYHYQKPLPSNFFSELNTVKLDSMTNNTELLNKENQLNENSRILKETDRFNPIRDSTDSNTSSISIIKKKRGRRPGSTGNNVLSSQTKYSSKRLKIIQSANETGTEMVCFGNKAVVKNTDEYKKRRVNNNEAVKKCRQKTAEEQKEKEARMKKLDEENKRLNSQVENLQKELNVLIGFIQMDPSKKIPEHIKELIKTIDET